MCERAAAATSWLAWSGVLKPASTAIPACSAARTIPAQPEPLDRLTDTKSGALRHARTAWGRANGSGSTSEDVVNPTGSRGAAARIASTAASHAAAAIVWAAAGIARVHMDRERSGPPSGTANASAASSAGLSGTAAFSLRVRPPFRHAMTIA